MMTTTKQLGRFLTDNGLRMAVDLSRSTGFVVKFECAHSRAPAGMGNGDTFPEAVDAALLDHAKRHASSVS